MERLDLDVRNVTYRLMVETGRAPSASDVAGVAGLDEVAVRDAWRRLHAAHAIVLDEDGAIRMLNPFSAVPTTFRVTAAGRDWYANCGWDAFGIGAALGVDSVIHTGCPDCHEPLTISVQHGHPEPSDLIWHVAVPARDWWHDIGYT
jgi:alkylmercury lyase-like protein